MHVHGALVPEDVTSTSPFRSDVHSSANLAGKAAETDLYLKLQLLGRMVRIAFWAFFLGEGRFNQQTVFLVSILLLWSS